MSGKKKWSDDMKENKYDDPLFFEKYSQMDRSKKGLDGAGEWKTLENMLPDFQGNPIKKAIPPISAVPLRILILKRLPLISF